MKKIIIIILLFVGFLFTNAQLALALPDNTPITNGQIFTFNSTGEATSTFTYKMINTSSSEIRVRIQVTSIVNGSGNGFQFCYYLFCLANIYSGQILPAEEDDPIILAPNAVEGPLGYTMHNDNLGTGTYPIDYNFKYYMVDVNNNEIGNSISFTYRYDPNAASVDDINQAKNAFVQIENTKFKDELVLIAKQKSTMNLFNVDGKLVLEKSLNEGKNNINTSTLPLGIYIASFTDNQGNTFTKKIIK